ncbi:MAG: glycosyltransferase family 2 protein [Bacteroidetes bacterium]|nr:MAG: glycosyltransferase family 2 protein [Bacteroidota bacterium]
MSELKTVDIILPCFNPRSGWERSLIDGISSVRRTLPADALRAVIVVNDGSTNGISSQGLETLRSTIPELQIIEYSMNRGKGHAVRTGVAASASDLQIYTDVDIPYVNDSIGGFYRVLANGEADVVIASRGDSYYDSLSAFRRILSKSLRWLNGLLFGLKINDTQGGLKGFNAKGREVFLTTRIERYLFDLEFIKLASKADLRLKAVDVQLKPDIVLPSPKPGILLKELNNFIQLLFTR